MDGEREGRSVNAVQCQLMRDGGGPSRRSLTGFGPFLRASRSWLSSSSIFSDLILASSSACSLASRAVSDSSGGGRRAAASGSSRSFVANLCEAERTREGIRDGGGEMVVMDQEEEGKSTWRN